MARSSGSTSGRATSTTRRPTTTCVPRAKSWRWRYGQWSPGSTFGCKERAPSQTPAPRTPRSSSTTFRSTWLAPSLWTKSGRWPSTWTRWPSIASRWRPWSRYGAVLLHRQVLSSEGAAHSGVVPGFIQSHMHDWSNGEAQGCRSVGPQGVATGRSAQARAQHLQGLALTRQSLLRDSSVVWCLPRFMFCLVVTLAKRKERHSSRSPRPRKDACSSKGEAPKPRRSRSRKRRRTSADEADEGNDPPAEEPNEHSQIPEAPAEVTKHVLVCMPQLMLGWIRARAKPQGITVRGILEGIVQQRFPELELSDLGLFPFIVPPPGFFDGATGPAAHLQLHQDELVFPSQREFYAVWIGNPTQARMRPGALEYLRASMQPFEAPLSSGSSGTAPAEGANVSHEHQSGVTAKALCRPPLSVEQAWLRSPLSEQQRKSSAHVSHSQQEHPPTTAPPMPVGVGSSVGSTSSVQPQEKEPASSGKRLPRPPPRPEVAIQDRPAQPASGQSSPPIQADAASRVQSHEKEPASSRKRLPRPPPRPEVGIQDRHVQTASVQRSPPRGDADKSSRVSSAAWDLRSVEPPTCATCGDKVWPVVRARSTKFHCKGCQDGWTVSGASPPTCAFCSTVSWDGIWRGRKFLEQGTAFVCSSCWIVDSGSPQEVTRWHDWFCRRATKYPDIFQQPPALGWCLDPT